RRASRGAGHVPRDREGGLHRPRPAAAGDPPGARVALPGLDRGRRGRGGQRAALRVPRLLGHGGARGPGRAARRVRAHRAGHRHRPGRPPARAGGGPAAHAERRRRGPPAPALTRRAESAGIGGLRTGWERVTICHMGLPEHYLTEGERIVLSFHPHWKRLVLPTLAFIAVTGAAAVAIYAIPGEYEFA